MTLIKNRKVPGGKEFWDHVEEVAESVQKLPTKEDERTLFEKWANEKRTFGFSWNGQHYENKLHETAWQGWQARARLGLSGRAE